MLNRVATARVRQMPLTTFGSLRCFHFKNESQSEAPITFDNGKEWEDGKKLPPNPTRGNAFGMFGAYPSALECEAQLPSKQQLGDALPSAAEAERLAMSAQTVESKNGDD